MKLVYLITILFVVSLVIAGMNLWGIRCKDLELREKTFAKRFLENQYTNLQKEFETRDAEMNKIIKNLQKENRRLREKLFKEKHPKYSHRVIFANGINDEYIDEKVYGFVSNIIARNEDRKGYIEINNNLFKIKDIDCVIKLNKE